MKPKITLIPAAFLMTAILLSFASFAQQDGSLDLTFDGDGKVTTNMNGISDENGYSVAIQSDGKILIAGLSGVGSNNDFAVVRYNSDGSLDNSFDGDGKVTTPIGSGHDSGFALAIQTDGKIVLVGFSTNGANYDIALVRYNTDGSLDNTFDGDGKLTTPIGTGDDRAYAIAFQSDGKIVVVGHSHNGSNYDMAVLRYNTDGSLDNTFDGDGKLTTPIGTNDNAYSVAIQTDGKIVVAGSTFSTSWDFAVLRYNSNGSLDNTFDTDGKVITDFGSATYDMGNSALLQPDGRIVVAGYSYVGSNTDFAVARYNTDGSLDNTFDSDGKVITAFGTNNDDGFLVRLQADGKIVVAGSSHDGTEYDIAVARYTTNGSLDNTFDTDGKVTTPIGAGRDAGYSLAIQADGKIVAGGFSYSPTSSDFALVRYNSAIALGINPVADQHSELRIYPNPFSSQATFQAGSILKDASLTVYNSLGQTVKEIKQISGQEFILDRDGLSGGLYFIHLLQDGRMIAADRLVIVD